MVGEISLVCGYKCRRRRTRRIPSLMMQYRMAAVAQLEGSHVNNIIMGSGGRHVFMMCWEFGVFGCAWVVRGKLLYSYLVLLLTYHYHRLSYTRKATSWSEGGGKADARGKIQYDDSIYDTTRYLCIVILICIMY